MHLFEILSALLMIMSFCGGVFLVISARAAARFAARTDATRQELPPITVLKPLHGTDDALLANLRSFCQQDYPQVQIVFGLHDQADAAYAAALQIRNEFPRLNIEIVVSSEHKGHNPKVANLINMLPAARHDVLVIADADMRVEKNYLKTVTAPLSDKNVGLVTCIYRGIPAKTLWSQLGAMHVNYGFLPQALVGDMLGSGAGCFGATLALTRDTLNTMGGFEVIADELADDHAMGQAVKKIGKKVILSSRIVDTIVYEQDLRDLIAHQLRWMRTVRFITPSGYAGSIVTHVVALATLALLLRFASHMDAPMLLFWTVMVCARMGTALFIQKKLALPRLKPLLLMLHDLLSFVLFISSFMSRSVEWRQSTFTIDKNRKIAQAK